MQAPSRPMLIGLLVVLAFAGVYFTALKPPGGGADKSSSYNGPIAAATSAVAASQTAAQQAAGQTSTTPAATPLHAVTPATPATTPATKPVSTPVGKKPAASSQLEDRSNLVFAVLAHHHVAVVLFWTKDHPDDKAAYRAVQSVKHTPGVRVFEVPISHVGDYTAIANAASINDSPTILVIGPNHQFQTIVGYTFAGAVQQAVALAKK